MDYITNSCMRKKKLKYNTVLVDLVINRVSHCVVNRFISLNLLFKVRSLCDLHNEHEFNLLNVHLFDIYVL